MKTLQKKYEKAFLRLKSKVDTAVINARKNGLYNCELKLVRKIYKQMLNDSDYKEKWDSYCKERRLYCKFFGHASPYPWYEALGIKSYTLTICWWSDKIGKS